MAPLVFITGASSGIGQALATRYAQQGWRLALVARRGEVLHDWVHAQRLDPSQARAYVADVADTEAIVAAGHACIESQGLPDLVIANAGISLGMDSAQREDLEVMARTLATNTLGVAATFHPFITPMVQRGRGTLVCIASVAGIRGMPGHGAYCASKAAVSTLFESFRIDLAGSGIAVTTIHPGFVATPLTEKNRHPMPFLMSAERAARIIADGLARRRTDITFPWQLRVLMGWMLRWTPAWIWDRVVAGPARRY